AYLEVLGKARRGDFPRPRTVSRSVPPALEAICLKAMAQEPVQRYATPKDLASDIEHWLADEPASAWREPWRERLSRWARRHRTWVQAGVATMAVVTIIAVGAAALIKNALTSERAAHQSEQTALASERAAHRSEQTALAQEKVQRREAQRLSTRLLI